MPSKVTKEISDYMSQLAAKSRRANIKKYGGIKGYKAEMKRRSDLATKARIKAKK